MKIKADDGISYHLYKKTYPTGTVAPKFYGLPKIHKRHPPKSYCLQLGFNHIWSGKRANKDPEASGRKLPPSHKEYLWFCSSKQVKGIKLQPNECIASYDVPALVTFVTIDPAITTIRRKLELDQELHLEATMQVKQIINLLKFCLKTTYFLFQGRIFEQLQGATMGSPHQPHCGQPLHGGLSDQDHQHSWTSSNNMEDWCRGHCKEREISGAHQQDGPTYPVYNRRW